MATNEKKMKSIDVAVDDSPEINHSEEVKEITSTTSDCSYENIDSVCDIVNTAKRDKAKADEERQKDAEKKRQQEIDNAVAAKKAADEKAKQEEDERKINQAKYMRRTKKRNASGIAFGVCLSSAIFSYVVIGIFINMLLEPSELLFIGIMGIIGAIDTYIHTYLYRYIREEIYRK